MVHPHGSLPFKIISMPVLPIKILDSYTTAPANDFNKEIAVLLHQKNAVVVVVDDDPTGAQYAGIPVLTQWSRHSIFEEVEKGSSLFFLLTNSRSLPVKEAIEIYKEAGKNISEAFEKLNRQYIIISRSDSTLRGHYPDDVNALAEGLQMKDYLTAIIPAFIEAGRYTINDTQYVQEGDQLLPVHLTQFANDKVFGYGAENLKQWVSEKSGGMIDKMSVASFSINELRENRNLSEKIRTLTPHSTLIVNAASYTDLQIFAKAYLESNVPMIFRSGPSFVAAIGCLNRSSLLTADELFTQDSKYGGLIVIGSYVSKTTRQLDVLLKTGIQAIELDIKIILEDPIAQANIYLRRVEEILKQKQDVVIYTGRQLEYGPTEDQSLQIGNNISAFLVQMIKQLSIRPRFLIVKGGITSHDIAVKALGIKRAIVMGQLLKGLPVWQTSNEALFPDMPYVVFPGNVGDDNTLAELYGQLTKSVDKIVEN